ncbi:hypothetical protein [Pseudomonas thivervalensis]|uniref:hypothetical protein n=1 Tax=Pseudomonas thivervalensis TaxID=86265 RepID=UPI00069ED154|nr:hypothetical protein [Pseudomonas thivervalensis]OAB50660.1 hypothetical protein APS14_06385 [Pseudomonas thivervalensis]
MSKAAGLLELGIAFLVLCEVPQYRDSFHQPFLDFGVITLAGWQVPLALDENDLRTPDLYEHICDVMDQHIIPLNLDFNTVSGLDAC